MPGSATRRGHTRLALLAAAVATLTALGTLVATTAQAATGCKATYKISAQWPGGFTADVEMTNLGEAVTGWKVGWTFPAAGQAVTQAWNATVTASGAAVTAVNAPWNGSLGRDATTSFGFNGAWTGSNPVPTAFTLNGIACTGRVTPSPGGPSPSTSGPPQPAGAMAIVAAMQPGWNLGNTLDAIPNETAWGNPLTTRAMLHHIKSQGYNSLRLPVTWADHTGPAPSYTIDPTWLARVKEIIDWALAEDLYVMINLHHDSWQWLNVYPTDTAAVTNRYTALWAQISTAFRDYSGKLVFESINEPQFAGVTDDQGDEFNSTLNTKFVQLVRATGSGNATRLLVLPTLHTSSEQVRIDALNATITALKDPNIAATVHFYGYWPFSTNIAGGTSYDSNVEADLLNTFDRVRQSFISRGIPVIIGEWALLSYDYTRPGIIERGEFLKFIEAFGNQARTHGVTTMLWDAGSFLERNTLTWRDQGIYHLMKANWTTRSATASSDQVFVAKSGAISAKTLTLHLNGTTFQGLYQNGVALTEGSDYTVSGTALTLTAAALTRLAGTRTYGTNATIEARFSAGVPWQIRVISADPPTVASASGTTTSFAIPTQFKGDVLATMEARYADGSGAGPAAWTSFKGFWEHFQPDYTANVILLKEAFFTEVTDAEPVTLTFHFWSGTTVTYRLTKTGTTVMGTTV